MPLTLHLLWFGPGCYTGPGDGVVADSQGAATEGESGAPLDSAGGTAATRGTGPGDSGAGTDAATDTAGPSAEQPVAPSTRFARLTHEQWENTVQDLFRLPAPTGLSASFRADPAQGGFAFGNDAWSLSVDEVLWSAYQNAASQLAVSVTTDATRLAGLWTAPATQDVTARGRAFITDFGARAYRRPLETAEIDAYLAIFGRASELATGTDPFTGGARLVIEAMLQSPSFLYRVERSATIDGDTISLDAYEVASRLSYFLWNTMPSDALFALAKDGSILDPTVRSTHARTMLADPRGADAITRFYHMLFEVDRFARIGPSATFFPNAPPDLAALAAEEHKRFVESVWASDGGFRDLLLRPETFVNDDLARIYGLSGSFGDTFVAAKLDPATRAGVFTQVGFLAAHATSVNPDPIHRGVFLARRIACLGIAAPPDNVPPLPPVAGKTNRKTVEDHTQAPGSTCRACHATIINPYGFAFEHYDAIGAYRDDDGGMPVDASTNVLIGNERVAVAGALELVKALAASPVVHACYAGHFLEFANGRPLAPEDEPLAASIGDDSHMSDLSLREVALRVVEARAFTHRSAKEMP